MVKSDLVQTNGLPHCGFDVQRLDILPVLFEERDEEVDTEHDVSEDLVVVHLDVTNSDTQAKDLLELELDGRTDLSNLVGEVLRVGYGGRELAGLGETGTKETRNLLDEDFRGKESVILLGKLLDELLVLVEFLQVVNGHVLEADLLGTIDIIGISKNADGHAGARDMGKFDSSRETLVTLGIVVLETDLKFDGLDEFAFLLASCFGKHIFDRAPHARH